MKISDGITVFSFSIEKVLKKHGKWFLKMRGNPVHDSQQRKLRASWLFAFSYFILFL